MLQRFMAATAIASIAIAIGTLMLLLMPGSRVSVLTTIWCFVPVVWGLWAMCAPSSWVPQRLPSWGAILGLLAGVFAAFFLNVPLRVLGLRLSVGMGILAALWVVVFYYLLWMVVRVAYRAIATDQPRAKAATAK